MSRYVFMLACVALIARTASAAPAEQPAEPPAGSGAGGILDAFRNAGGQLQRVATNFPQTASVAASRFQTWAEDAGSRISKSASDGFGLGKLFNTRRTEDAQPPSSGSSSTSP